MDVNKIILTGTLTHKPYLNTTNRGRSVCNLSVSCNSSPDHHEIFAIITWDELAEKCVCELSEGSPVLIEGRLRHDEWTNRTGERRDKIKILASNIKFLRNQQDN